MASRGTTAPTPPASPLSQEGWDARTLATATATTTKTKSEGRRRDNDRRGQEEAGCVVHGRRPRLARVAVAMETTAREDLGDGDNEKDKEGDEDGDGNEDEVATKTTTR